MPFQIAIFERSPRPAYQRIAQEARRLRTLGLSAAVIGAHLGVPDKTVSKALAWIEPTIES